MNINNWVLIGVIIYFIFVFWKAWSILSFCIFTHVLTLNLVDRREHLECAFLSFHFMKNLSCKIGIWKVFHHCVFWNGLSNCMIFWKLGRNQVSDTGKTFCSCEFLDCKFWWFYAIRLEHPKSSFWCFHFQIRRLKPWFLAERWRWLGCIQVFGHQFFWNHLWLVQNCHQWSPCMVSSWSRSASTCIHYQASYSCIEGLFLSYCQFVFYLLRQNVWFRKGNLCTFCFQLWFNSKE